MLDALPPGEIADVMTIRRVANGWIIVPGKGDDQFIHVSLSPDDLSVHVRNWANAQIESRTRR